MGCCWAGVQRCGRSPHRVQADASRGRLGHWPWRTDSKRPGEPARLHRSPVHPDPAVSGGIPPHFIPFREGTFSYRQSDMIAGTTATSPSPKSSTILMRSPTSGNLRAAAPCLHSWIRRRRRQTRLKSSVPVRKSFRRWWRTCVLPFRRETSFDQPRGGQRGLRWRVFAIRWLSSLSMYSEQHF